MSRSSRSNHTFIISSKITNTSKPTRSTRRPSCITSTISSSSSSSSSRIRTRSSSCRSSMPGKWP